MPSAMDSDAVSPPRMASIFSALLLSSLTRAAGSPPPPSLVAIPIPISEIVADRHVYLVEFMSGRCGTCQEFAPEWAKLAAALEGRLRIASYDIDEAPGLRAAQEAGVLEDGGGVPTVRLYDGSGGAPASFQTLIVGTVGDAGELTARVATACDPLPRDAEGLWLRPGVVVGGSSGGGAGDAAAESASRRLRGGAVGSVGNADAAALSPPKLPPALHHPLLRAANWWWLVVGGGVAASILVPMSSMVMKVRRQWLAVKSEHQR